MARIRTLKPEFPQSESMGRVSRDARLLFVQLWTICDDSGRTRAASRMLASLLYPYDNDAPDLIDGWLGELEREQCLDRYVVDGSTYLQIRNWLNHQKIDKPSKSKFPEFVEGSRIVAKARERSSGDLRIGGSEDQGPRTKDQGPTTASSTPLAKVRSKLADPAWFTQFKLAYPDRAGDQGWHKALRAAHARLAEGHKPAELIDGATRYAAFVEATGKAHTEFVKQAATFLGPDKSFLLPWSAPAAAETPMDKILRLNGDANAHHHGSTFEHESDRPLAALGSTVRS